MSDWLRTTLTELSAPDQAAIDAVDERAAQILRPAGALARLDDVASWMAGWQRTSTPAVTRPAALIFAADHGVAAASAVSAGHLRVLKYALRSVLAA